MQDSGQVIVNPDGNEPQSVPAQEPLVQEPAGPPEEDLATKLSNLEKSVQHFQSIADRRYQENLMLQAKLNETQGRPSTPVESTNPHNMQNDFANWLRWEQDRSTERTTERVIQTVFQRAQEMTKAQQESQWQSSHPEVDINAVKAFAQVRGVSQLDDAYILMTMQQREAGIAQNVLNKTTQQIRNQNTAAPLRGQPAVAPGKVSFAETLKAVNENPAIEKTWSPEFKAAFEQELRAREELLRKGRL